MAFNLDGIIIDRIQLAVAEDFDGNPLYTLTQLSDATIETTAESKDATDKDGTLIKRFWQSKAATFTATNAMMDFNVLGEQSGSGKQVASADEKIVMPKIEVVKNGTLTLDITGCVKSEGAPVIHVNAMANNGTMGAAFTVGDTAVPTKYSVSADGNTLTLPVGSDADKFLVRYDREVASGAMVKNSADEFPGTIKLTVKALAVDPCSADTLRSVYITMPSFQVDPNTSLQLTTDATFEFKGVRNHLLKMCA